MDKNVLTKINFILTGENITPYDILLAMGQKDLVPASVAADRLVRTVKRDGMETPIGYLKNAYEDLSKLDFGQKATVLKLLQGQIKSSFSGLGQTSAPAPPASMPPPLSPSVLDSGSSSRGMIFIILLLAIPVYLIFRKREINTSMISGLTPSTKNKRK